MAEAFRSAFGLGSREDVISMVDSTGVALAAIQGMRMELEVRDREIAKLRHQLLNEISALKAAVEELETRQLE